ncbi:MAG: thiaminase II [Tannerella sp.]|jgi:thiaminase/transcriptional activator TenA|nr:thiaminase II [Tannerella sp.]
MKWSENAWSSVELIYGKTIELPFIKEIIDGTLDKKKFVFYIQQDSLYLADYAKIMTGLATRVTDLEHVDAFLGFTKDCLYVENELHQTLFAQYGVTDKPRRTPTCLLYTSYLLSQFLSPVEVMAASFLPCFWVYKAVGDYIHANQTADNNPYQAWIDTYGGEEFTASVNKAINICDTLAAAATEQRRNEMTEAFVTACRMEWMFWDSAYNLEQWKV